MNPVITEKAYAKLNLSLDILGRRPDGYHDMLMVMASVDLCDDVTITLRPDGGITCRSSFPWVPDDDRNLAVKAAKAFFARLGENHGADIVIEKRIPSGAGMAGGSSDAAAVLRGLNRLCGSPLTAEALAETGLSVGSDVPYCLVGGVQLAAARGERMEPLPPVPDCRVVICKPAFSVSTGELFARYDESGSNAHPDTDSLVSALGHKDLQTLARSMFNVFEEVMPPRGREIREICGTMLDYGALGAVMTGTGSASFGLFDSPEKAESAAAELKKNYTDCFTARFV